MKLPITFVLCCTIILVSGAENTVINQNLNKTVSSPPEPPPSPSPETTTLTPAPDPTKPPTPTSPPATTTPKPDTTTSPTPAPTTAPTPAPGPIPIPPAPKPQTSQWIVNGTNQTCIILQMAAQFNVTYLDTKNKNTSRVLTLPTSNLTTTSGICGDTEQVIQISWKSTVPPMTDNDTLIIHFVKNTTKYALHHMELYLANYELPNIKSNSSTVMLIHNASEYQIPLSNSYRCLKLQQINLASNVTNTTGTFAVSDLRFQAFRNDKTTGFGLAEDCPIETADYVPIAVGVGLIILVVVVLIAYIVGRRISMSRGYLSM